MVTHHAHSADAKLPLPHLGIPVVLVGHQLLLSLINIVNHISDKLILEHRSLCSSLRGNTGRRR